MSGENKYGEFIKQLIIHNKNIGPRLWRELIWSSDIKSKEAIYFQHSILRFDQQIHPFNEDLKCDLKKAMCWKQQLQTRNTLNNNQTPEKKATDNSKHNNNPPSKKKRKIVQKQD